MMDQLDIFDKLKSVSVPYPQQKYPYGSSLCHYWHPAVRRPFRELVRQLRPNAQYLELGSFLGAGSTALAMQSHPTLQAVCADHWIISTHRLITPVGAKVNGVEVDFLKDKGTSLEHFINNTWQWQDRIAPMQVKITPQFLEGLGQEGYNPDLILIDDDHTTKAVIERLDVIRNLWPNALVVLDDHTARWDPVRKGVKTVFDRGWYRESDSQLLGRRLMVLKRSSTSNANTRSA